MKCKHPNCILLVDKRQRVILARTGEDTTVERRLDESLIGVLAYCPECQLTTHIGPCAAKWPKWIERLVGWARSLPEPKWYGLDVLQQLAKELRGETPPATGTCRQCGGTGEYRVRVLAAAAQTMEWVNMPCPNCAPAPATQPRLDLELT